MVDVTGKGFETRAIHAGQPANAENGAVMTPIYATSTYKQDGVGGLRGGYEYSRTSNPTRRALEECLAALEEGVRAVAFSSGMAAEDALLRVVCSRGDHVIIPTDAYGGTYRLVKQIFEPWGLDHTPAGGHDLEAISAALQPGRTRVIWIETPTNPLLGIADIAALATIAKDNGALLVVDNTFATPYLQRPLTLGADVVVHSTTKYVGGHSDVVGGAVVTPNEELGAALATFQNSTGAIAGPFDAYLTLRGLKTLAVRMERHCDNAERVVEALRAHEAVVEVFYPGIKDHPGHEIAVRQMDRFGGMVSFRVKGGAEAARSVCERAEIFTLAESLGGVESLVELPATMTHASVADSPLAVPPDLVRLSVGIESVQDLIADLDVMLSV
ncbi:MAG: cystathionine gamma-synthase [Nocardioidaceae bacterium]|jgi:cystathionine gamma-synthase|nr:cystathionine gamma-synthase [Nocardioidaceae bacterium]